MKNLIHHFPTCYAYSVKMHNSMLLHVERLYSESNLLFGCKESVVLNVLSQAWRAAMIYVSFKVYCMKSADLII